MSSPRSSDRPSRRRIGIYGVGVVAPGGRDVNAFESLLQRGGTALGPSSRPGFGNGLFSVGEPDFSFDDYAAWIAERHGEAYVTRLRAKMADNVQFAVGATIQALRADPNLERLVKEVDEGCHVYVGSGVGELPESYRAAASLERATRAWNHFWAQPERCGARKRFDQSGTVPQGEPPPQDPTTLPVDSDARFEARKAWDAYWSRHSEPLHAFLERFAAIERLDADDENQDNAHMSAMRKRSRAHRALVTEYGCPPPPWTEVSPNLIWNIQNGPAAQITMLLGVHGAAFAPVGACSTFGVALKCGRDAILRGEAKMAIVGTTDPRPDAALVAAFHQARVMPGIPEVNLPFTSLRGTHVSGGSCIWVIGDAEFCEERNLRPIGGYVEAVALASDAEHIITPSQSGPKRAIVRAYAEAGIEPSDVSVIDLHATGTPGDLNELALIDEFVTDRTRITARKGQLGHGMANSGGWELTELALSLSRGTAYPTGVAGSALHPRVQRKGSIVMQETPLEGDIGVKLMLGIGGITACIVMRGGRTAT